MKKILLVFFILSNFAFGLEVNRDILTTSIENREPINEISEFNLYDKAYYFTEITNANEEQYIYHVWYYIQENGIKNKMAKVKLKVAGNRWRTWSSKNLWLEGVWEVEVVDKDNNLLSKKEFVVK
ncbi:DUF2914 family protein [Hypnocyclicus thermotrophus]|uniref:DUF2914 family protein n=1 Tax=Hypnocyclicus thermotrophus TaxID=1627895 RepID=A0AA46I6G5_9FUSO|nr:DUF2914 domain-containing protein [Hypnocyclicus thermotrophus]TDT72312.1 DUF2914 family protein [Hypnocyclicus thermotrophus]